MKQKIENVVENRNGKNPSVPLWERGRRKEKIKKQIGILKIFFRKKIKKTITRLKKIGDWGLMKKRKIVSVLGVVVVGVVTGFFLVYAQEIIDSFTSDSSVADTWNVEVDTTAGEVKLEARSCDSGTWFCGTGYDDVCANTLGDGDYIVVAKTDIATTQQWKSENTACNQSQCGIDGGQNGDEMVADNTVNFADYPARQACKAIGGRLPTKTELSYIYSNKTTFGDNFGTSYYWSATEYNATNAWYVRFSDGYVSSPNKTNSFSVRCVLGW